MNSIGERIRTIRKKNNISQKDLSKLTGLTNDYISKLEVGRRENPSIETLSKIASALNCTVDELTGEQKQLGSIEEAVNKIISTTKANTDQVTVAGLILERLIEEKIIDENFTFTPKLKELLEDAVRLDAKLHNNLKKKGSDQ